MITTDLFKLLSRREITPWHSQAAWRWMCFERCRLFALTVKSNYLSKQRHLTSATGLVGISIFPKKSFRGKDFVGQERLGVVKAPQATLCGQTGTFRNSVAGKDALCSGGVWPRSRSSGSSPLAWGMCRVWHWWVLKLQISLNCNI